MNPADNNTLNPTPTVGVPPSVMAPTNIFARLKVASLETAAGVKKMTYEEAEETATSIEIIAGLVVSYFEDHKTTWTALKKQQNPENAKSVFTRVVPYLNTTHSFLDARDDYVLALAGVRAREKLQKLCYTAVTQTVPSTPFNYSIILGSAPGVKCIGGTTEILLYEIGKAQRKVGMTFDVKSYDDVSGIIESISTSEKNKFYKKYDWHDTTMTMAVHLATYHSVNVIAGKIEIRKAGTEVYHPQAPEVVAHTAHSLMEVDKVLVGLLEARRVGNLNTDDQASAFYLLLSDWKVYVPSESHGIIEDAKVFYAQEIVDLHTKLVASGHMVPKTGPAILDETRDAMKKLVKDKRDDQINLMEAYFKDDIPFKKATNTGRKAMQNEYYSSVIFPLSKNRVGTVTSYRTIRSVAEMMDGILASILYVGSGGITTLRALNKSTKVHKKFKLNEGRVPKRHWFGEATAVTIGDTLQIPKDTRRIRDMWEPKLLAGQYEILYIQQFPDSKESEQNVLDLLNDMAGTSRVAIVNYTLPGYAMINNFWKAARTFGYQMRIFSSFEMRSKHCLLVFGKFHDEYPENQAWMDRYAVFEANWFNVKREVIKASIGYVPPVYPTLIRYPGDPSLFDREAIVLACEVKEETKTTTGRVNLTEASEAADTMAEILERQQKKIGYSSNS